LTDENFVIEDITEEDTRYGLLAPEETVIIRAYSDDSDDRMLAELQPKYIVMFEPSMDFVRRIEVVRASLLLSSELTALAGVSKLASRSWRKGISYGLSRFMRGTQIPRRDQKGERVIRTAYQGARGMSIAL